MSEAISKWCIKVFNGFSPRSISTYILKPVRFGGEESAIENFPGDAVEGFGEVF